MNTKIIGKILFYILAGTGLVLGIMVLTKPSKNPEIDILNAKIHKLDSLYRQSVKIDSILQLQLDTLKNNYAKSKGKYKSDSKKYDNVRSTISVPDL